MRIAKLALIALLVLATIPAYAQQNSARPDYAPGQVWNTKLGVRFIILAVDDSKHDKKHKVSEKPLPELIRMAQTSYPVMCGDPTNKSL